MDVTRPDRFAWLTLAAGLLLLVLVQLPARNVPAALYDGVVVEDPYRYLDPPAGALGDPASATATAQVESGSVAQLYAATSEVPPQAQVITEQGALIVPDGAFFDSCGEAVRLHDFKGSYEEYTSSLV